MSGPVPSDYDDHHGRAARSGPHRTGVGRWRRSPQTAGISRRWRLDAFAISDIVPDSGGVYVHGVGAGEGALTSNGRPRAGTYVFALSSMNFSETFIRRPIATSLLMAAIALFCVVP